MENNKLGLITRFLFKNKKRFQKIRSRIDYESVVKSTRYLDKENLRKGTDFEAFVVRQFDSDYFTLIEWRSDKRTDDIIPLSSQFPDLEFYFECSSCNLVFAIECKWRSDFIHDQFSFKEAHLKNYRLYEEVTGHPTFIILGIGGRPGAPNTLYIIPLSKIDKCDWHEWELNVYKRENIHAKFFLNCDLRHLK